MHHLDIWDYLTFLTFFVIGIGVMCTIVLVLGMPGRIAHKRNHPDAEAIDMMGWMGFFAVVPWMQAFLWAFKDGDVIDIRRFPREEKQFLAEQSRKYAEEHPPRKSKRHKPAPPESDTDHPDDHSDDPPTNDPA